MYKTEDLVYNIQRCNSKKRGGNEAILEESFYILLKLSWHQSMVFVFL